MKDIPRNREHSTSDRVPHKPTKESALASGDRDEYLDTPPDPAGPRTSGHPAARKRVDEQATAQRHPPHVTENDEDAAVQDDTIAPNEVPVLPANASGEDRVEVDDQNQPIDRESMYDDRPERGKHSPPSRRVDG